LAELVYDNDDSEFGARIGFALLGVGGGKGEAEYSGGEERGEKLFFHGGYPGVEPPGWPDNLQAKPAFAG